MRHAENIESRKLVLLHVLREYYRTEEKERKHNSSVGCFYCFLDNGSPFVSENLTLVCIQGCFLLESSLDNSRLPCFGT